MTRWLPLLALVACVRPPSLSHHELDMLTAAELGWQRSGLGDPGDCLRGTRVVYHDSWDSFRQRCHTQEAAECLTRYSEGALGRRKGWQVNIAPGSLTAPRDVRHAALHALVFCHHERGYWQDGDPGHMDLRVWGDYREGSAEWHARLAAGGR